MNIHFYVLIRSWNAFPYLETCLHSVLAQESTNYTILFVDDCSEYSKQQKNWIQRTLKNHVVIFNTERKFAVRNAYEVIHQFADKKKSVVVNVDGDDWLHGTQVLHTLEAAYQDEDCVLTYGDCLYFSPGQPIHLQRASSQNEYSNHPFSQEVVARKSYRKEIFNPLHLRTWKSEAYKRIPKTEFLRPDKTWLKYCEDQAILYPLLEKCEGNYKVLTEPLYIYNVETPLSDNKVNRVDRLVDELILRRKIRNGS